MQQEIISQKEFVEACKGGKREFSGMLMQFFDISGLDLPDIKLKNCKLMFCTFRNCNFKNATFENCDIYCGSFYNGNISNTSFSGCRIELTLFESIQFDRTKMDRCSIRLCAIFNSNHASVDASTSTQSRLLTDVSQITQADIEGSIQETMAYIARLDVGTRMKLKELLRQDMERYNLTAPSQKKTGSYGREAKDSSHITYGEVKHMLESAFGAYSQKGAYEMKNPYESTPDKDRKKGGGLPF